RSNAAARQNEGPCGELPANPEGGRQPDYHGWQADDVEPRQEGATLRRRGQWQRVESLHPPQRTDQGIRGERNLMTGQFLSIGLLLLSLSQTAENKLGEFIPSGKWETTGISKLTDSEGAALGNEIRTLLLQCHNSLTDGVAVIAPSVSTSMKAREIRA